MIYCTFSAQSLRPNRTNFWGTLELIDFLIMRK